MAPKLTPAQIKARRASFEAQDYRAFRKFVAENGGTYTTVRSIDSGQPYHLVRIYVDLPDGFFTVSRSEGWSGALMDLQSELAEARKSAAA